MSSVRSWKRRARFSCRREARRREAPGWSALLVLPLLIAASGCAGLYQRALPDHPAGCVHVAIGPLSVGFAAADITPIDHQYMGGFGLARTSTGVYSPLKVRAMVLQVGTRKVAILGLDNLGLQREDAEWIKLGLSGFANGDVFLCSSHTHAAPDLIGLWGFYFLTSGRDIAYLTRVREQCAAAVEAATRALRPATLWLGEARLPRRGIVKNSNRRGVFNRRVTILEARAKDDGAPFGAILHLACHPEMLRRRNTLLSSDFVGALCDRWRAAGHGQAVFVNGELGAMVTPDHNPRGVEGMPLVGNKLLELFESARTNATQLTTDRLEIRRRDVYLPLSSPGLVLGRLSGAIRRELFGGCLRASVGYLKLGAFEAISVPGEMEPVLAEEIRRQTRRPNLLVFGLVDDEVGYLMRGKDAVDPNFAYERTMTPGPDAGELVRAALVGR